MDERKLRDFFLGRISARRLASTIEGSVSHPNQITSVVYVRDLKLPFTVTREMALSLCDAASRGELPLEHLRWIGFTLHASDRFAWKQDDVLSAVFEDWSSPEINWPLTTENVGRFKRWLAGEEAHPQAIGFSKVGKSEEKLISVTRKVSCRYPKTRAFLSRVIGGS